MPVDNDLLNPRKASGLSIPLVAGAALLLVAAAFFIGRASGGSREPSPAASATVVATAEATPDAGLAAPTPEAAPAAAAAAAPPGEAIPGTASLRRARVKVVGSIDQSLSTAVGPEVGAPLTQVSTRLLVWWLDISRDVLPGDELDVVYELPSGKEPVVHGLRYASAKLGKELRAYRYHPPGAPFPRTYDEKGVEVEERLKDGPLDSYEQVTSLLRDGRGHKGVDFKTPVGTPVKAPWDGVVERANWNFRGNGNCLQLSDGRGRTLLFLHLSEVTKGIGAGSRVKKGQEVALSGNTGRSTAPHLHYQLMSSGGKVLDPFEVHETYRTTVPVEALAGFETARAKLDELLGLAAATANEL